MDSELLWINEGFVLDEAGNLIMTSYVDLRPPGSRAAIRTLVKGCRREHALENTGSILVSPLERFRKEGENLIRDEQEGLVTEKTETVKPETPEEAFRRRRVADANQAIEVLGSGVRLTRQESSRSVEGSSRHFSYGNEWWIFSTALTPETEEQWAEWRASLDSAYDHEWVIGQPAKFAEALGRMVTEQLGPQGNDGWTWGSIGEREGARTRHPAQWILHGPVVYADQLYDKLMAEEDEKTRMLTAIFIKSATHAAQREYRFAIFRGDDSEEKVFLTASGMMRDALQPTTTGLVRPTPESAEPPVNEESGSPSRASGPTKLLYKRVTTKEWATRREEMRSETRGSDGEILSSESKLRESAQEKTVTRELDAEEQPVDVIEVMGGEDGADAQHLEEQGLLPGGAVQEPELNDEDAVKEIAFEESSSSDRDTEMGDGASVVHGGGRAYKTFEEVFREQFDDPAFPMGGLLESWIEKALSPEEVLGSYKMVTLLGHKVTQVGIENREAASSACWHAMQCIRNIYARFGDIVDTVAIERGRFVVLRIKESEELKATGRIVISPSGSYAYWLKRSGKEEVGHGEGLLGLVFFPLGSDVERFESFGWPPKEM